MYRIEIIANRSLEQDLFEALQRKKLARHYSLLYNVKGVGASGARLGNITWPEENFIMIIYCDAPEGRGIRKVVETIRAHNLQDGIALFSLPPLPTR